MANHWAACVRAVGGEAVLLELKRKTVERIVGPLTSVLAARHVRLEALVHRVEAFAVRPPPAL